MKITTHRNINEIIVIGSGEAFDSQFGNTAYLLKTENKTRLLFDCGYQIPERLWDKSNHTDLDGVCFTHLHADHTFGMTPLLVRYWEEKRTKPFYVFGPRGTKSHVQQQLELGYPGFSHLLNYSLEFLELDPTRTTQWKDITLSSAQSNHSVLNLTIHVTIHSSPPVVFAVSGDGQITDATKALVNDVGLLLQEVYTLNPEIITHADLFTIEEFILSSHIRRIGVSHHSRQQVVAISKRVRKLFNQDPKWFLALPDMNIILKPRGR